MRHQMLMRDYRGFAGGTVGNLPDGRRLVTGFNRPVKLVDTEGNEIAASPAEIAALMAFRGASVARKIVLE